MDPTPPYVMTSLALVGRPGPNTMSLTAFGTRRGCYMIGLDLGMVAVVALVGSGRWAVMLSFPGIGGRPARKVGGSAVAC